MLKNRAGVRRGGEVGDSATKLVTMSMLASAVLILAATSGCSSSPTRHEAGISSTGAAGAAAQPAPATTADVLAAIKAAQTLKSVPTSLRRRLAQKDDAGPRTFFECTSVNNPSHANPFGNCAYGDPKGTKLMVIYGDSRAAMWGATLEGVAKRLGWKLKVFGLGGCPVPNLHFFWCS